MWAAARASDMLSWGAVCYIETKLLAYKWLQKNQNEDVATFFLVPKMYTSTWQRAQP